MEEDSKGGLEASKGGRLSFPHRVTFCKAGHKKWLQDLSRWWETSHKTLCMQALRRIFLQKEVIASFQVQDPKEIREDSKSFKSFPPTSTRIFFSVYFFIIVNMKLGWREGGNEGIWGTICMWVKPIKRSLSMIPEFNLIFATCELSDLG